MAIRNTSSSAFSLIFAISMSPAYLEYQRGSCNRYRCGIGDARKVVAEEYFSGTGLRSALVLRVSDAGEGISLEVQKRAFGELERAAGNDIPGAGLGMVIVKALVGKSGRLSKSISWRTVLTRATGSIETLEYHALTAADSRKRRPKLGVCDVDLRYRRD
jgi:hypothetical protein